MRMVTIIFLRFFLSILQLNSEKQRSSIKDFAMSIEKNDLHSFDNTQKILDEMGKNDTCCLRVCCSCCSVAVKTHIPLRGEEKFYIYIIYYI